MNTGSDRASLEKSALYPPRLSPLSLIPVQEASLGPQPQWGNRVQIGEGMHWFPTAGITISYEFTALGKNV